MVLRIYTILDVKAAVHHIPMFSHNDAAVKRILSRTFSDEKTMYSWTPEDYQIFCLGEYDDESGKITTSLTKEFICLGSDLVRKEKINDSNNGS